MDAAAEPSPSAGGRARSAPTARTAFAVTAVAFTFVMAVGTAPTPLWPIYQTNDRLTTTVITVLSGAVVVGALVSFLLLGPLSDRHGRRRALVPAVLTSASAMLIMAAWHTEAGLLVGRLATGLALGVVAPAAPAYLVELRRLQPAGSAPSSIAATVATAANLGGLALGPVLSGVLAELFPSPLQTTYLVIGGVLVFSAPLLWACPETVGAAPTARRARFALQPDTQVRFAAAATAGFVSFAVTGIFAALGAIVVRGALAVTSVLVWGLSTGLVFAASAVAQLAAARWTALRLSVVGAGLLPAGLGLLLVSVAHPQLALYLLASAVTGAACGLLFKAGLATSAAVAVPASRAGVLAVHFAIAYVGMGTGAFGLALIERVTGTALGLAIVGGAMTVLAIVSSVATELPGEGGRASGLLATGRHGPSARRPQ